MSPFWRGFFSIFQPGQSRLHRTREMLKQSKARESWYHPGPWWKHPLWGDTWKDKK